MIGEMQHDIPLFQHIHNPTRLFEQGVDKRLGSRFDIIKNLFGKIHKGTEVMDSTARY